MSASDVEIGWSPKGGLAFPDGVEEEDVFGPAEGLEEPSPDYGASTSEPVDEVLFASSSSSDPTYRKVRHELEEDGIDVSRLDPNDVEERDGEVFLDGERASELDAKVYLRPKRWRSVEDDSELFRDLIDAQEDGVDFYGDPQAAMLAEDKKATKNVFSSKGVGSVDDFSYEEARSLLEGGEEVVVKPRYNSSCGEDVDLVSSVDELEAYDEEKLRDEMLIEEYLPQGSGEENADMRMVLTGEDTVRAERVNGNGVANNLSNGGKYTEPPEMSDEEQYLEEVGSEVLGEGFYSIDYIRESDGSVKVMEINSTSGTGIDREMEGDLYSSIAEGLKSREYSAASPDQDMQTRSQRPATV